MITKILNSSKSESVSCSVMSELCLTLCDPMDDSPPGSSVRGILPGKNTGVVGCHSLLQGDLPNPGEDLVSRIAGGFFTSWATRGFKPSKNTIKAAGCEQTVGWGSQWFAFCHFCFQKAGDKCFLKDTSKRHWDLKKKKKTLFYIGG